MSFSVASEWRNWWPDNFRYFGDSQGKVLGCLTSEKQRKALSALSVLPGIMGCSCSSNPDDDWMENIDVCEICNYPIVPLDEKATVRWAGSCVRELGRIHNREERNEGFEIPTGPSPRKGEQERGLREGRGPS